MAKYTDAELVDIISGNTSLDVDVKAQLIKLLREKKTYGLVWERNPEDANEILRECIPIFEEDCDKAIKSSDENSPNHVLIEGDNLHVLTTLCYTHEGKFDAIYIDPPYNSGATDWKYNNDYVDKEDTYRHSKWLSMIENRVKIAKRLLKPDNSVLIVTIDEKEYLHLGCLLEEMFPAARIQMVSSVINTAGATRQSEFARTDEYLFFVYIGECKPQPLLLGREWLIGKSSNQGKITWDSLRRAGSQNKRSDSPGCFYPIFVSKDGTKIVSVGDAIPLGQDRKDTIAPDGTVAIWPLHEGEIEGRWQTSPDNFRELLRKGFVKIGKFTGEETMAISYLKRGEQQKVETGFYEVIGHREDGSIIVNDDIQDAAFLPGTQWNIPSHNAKQNGTILLNSIIGKDKFSFPKSLYAVRDALKFFVADKPDALILDFFAGSGTTLHATMLLNEEDGGHRQCFLVTNNESNICEDVTYERNKRVINGYKTPKGVVVDGLHNNSLRYFRTKLLSRALTHQNKRALFSAMIDVIRIKEDCYTACGKFGSLDLSGKDRFIRYYQEDGKSLLLLFDSRIIPIIVKEIAKMGAVANQIKIYVFADGSCPYTADFESVIHNVDLIAMPSSILSALKYILPTPVDERIDSTTLTQEELLSEMKMAIESESQSNN